MFLPFGSALIGALLTIEKQTAIQLSSQLWYVVRRLQKDIHLVWIIVFDLLNKVSSNNKGWFVITEYSNSS